VAAFAADRIALPFWPPACQGSVSPFLPATHYSAPGASHDHVALGLAQAGFPEGGFGRGREAFAACRPDQLMQVLVDAIGAHAGFQHERTGAHGRIERQPAVHGTIHCL
jgi:hypothetical protein